MLEKFPRVRLAHCPTPFERWDNLSKELGTARIFAKRDDCTGLAMGGNKARQLEFYLGEAQANDCDAVVSTGAVQSNFVRMLAAGASKLGMECHIQLEDRVPNMPEEYHVSGNVLLDRILGAHLYFYPHGEDESGADARLHEIAEELRARGRRPYVASITANHPPIGALGYVDAAGELLGQAADLGIDVDAMVVASGGAFTHTGLLVGSRALGSRAQVAGICVRRDAPAQRERVLRMARALCEMLAQDNLITPTDVWVEDRYLGAGYGRVPAETIEAIDLAARCEGVLLDPVYSGKTLAGLIGLVRQSAFKQNANIVFVHTGGVPALFGYRQALLGSNSEEEGR